MSVTKMSNPEKEGKINFLTLRLKIVEKEWEKANKKWVNSKNDDRVKAFNANAKVKNSMTKMAFLNGQRKMLKELITLERV